MSSSNAALAQLDRAPLLRRDGRGFESPMRIFTGNLSVLEQPVFGCFYFLPGMNINSFPAFCFRRRRDYLICYFNMCAEIGGFQSGLTCTDGFRCIGHNGEPSGSWGSDPIRVPAKFPTCGGETQERKSRFRRPAEKELSGLCSDGGIA